MTQLDLPLGNPQCGQLLKRPRQKAKSAVRELGSHGWGAAVWVEERLGVNPTGCGDKWVQVKKTMTSMASGSLRHWLDGVQVPCRDDLHPRTRVCYV